MNLSCFPNVTGKCYLAFCDLHLTVKMYMHGGGWRQFALSYTTWKFEVEYLCSLSCLQLLCLMLSGCEHTGMWRRVAFVDKDKHFRGTGCLLSSGLKREMLRLP